MRSRTIHLEHVERLKLDGGVLRAQQGHEKFQVFCRRHEVQHDVEVDLIQEELCQHLRMSQRKGADFYNDTHDNVLIGADQIPVPPKHLEVTETKEEHL